MITLEKAAAALRASEDAAKKRGLLISTAIVDDYGVLIAFSRMDGALHISPRFAHAKAFTAAALGMPSGDVASYAGEGKPYFSVNTSFGGEMMIIAGALPVKHQGKTVGAVGVGGSMDVVKDVECAQEALKVLES